MSLISRHDIFPRTYNRQKASLVNVYSNAQMPRSIGDDVLQSCIERYYDQQ